jgi:hypothetical protein
MVVSAMHGRHRPAIRGWRPRVVLTHRVFLVAGRTGVEVHLDHRISATRGQHRIVGPEGLVAWMADAGDVHAAFEIAATCPCRRSRPQAGAARQGEPPCRI